MQVDRRFASRVAEVAAKMVADGWPYGTFDKPEWCLAPGAGVESAMMRAGHEVWGGPGWWRRNMAKAELCLRSIRWAVCEYTDPTSHQSNESEARERWKSLSTDETVVMLLFSSRFLLSADPPLLPRTKSNEA